MSSLTDSVPRLGNSQQSTVKELVQSLVATLSDNDLFLYLKWCNSGGIRVALERETLDRCELALRKLCTTWEYRLIASRTLIGLDHEKRTPILNRWLEAGKSQLPYKDAAEDCLSVFNRGKIDEWNPEVTDFEIPDEYVYLGHWPEEFPSSAKKCIFCENPYEKWQMLLRTDCDNGHTFHETCEMKDDRERGIVEGICVCNGGGYQSRNELESEIRDRLPQEQRQGRQP